MLMATRSRIPPWKRVEYIRDDGTAFCWQCHEYVPAYVGAILNCPNCGPKMGRIVLRKPAAAGKRAPRVFKGEKTGAYCPDCGNEMVRLPHGGMTCPYGSWRIRDIIKAGLYRKHPDE